MHRRSERVKKTTLLDEVLHRAAEEVLPENVKLLLEHDAGVNSRDEIGDTPLLLTAGNGLPNILEALLELGADVNAKDASGKTALHRAIEGCYSPRCVQSLLEHGADVNDRDDNELTPLFLAVRRDSRDGKRKKKRGTEFDALNISRILLDHGANVDDTFEFDNTLLHIAARDRKSGQVELLLEYGANVNALGFCADTPLCELFQSSKHLKYASNIIRILVKYGANVQTKNEWNRTPAHELLCNYNTEDVDVSAMFDVITELLSHGADFNTEDVDDLTPFMIIWELRDYVSASRKAIVVDRINKLMALSAIEMAKKNRPLFCEIAASIKKSYNKSMREPENKLTRDAGFDRDQFDECIREAEKLNKVWITRDITLGDVLTLGNPVTMTKISSNFQIHAESKDLTCNYPAYSFLIRYQYDKSRELKLLCDECEISLGNLYNKLNRDCNYLILQYLSETDKKNLNEAMEDIYRL